MPGGDLGFEVADRAVYLPSAGALVAADLHLGRDATSNVELSLDEHGSMAGRLAGLLARFEPEEVVLAGDVFHAFSHVPAGTVDILESLRSLIEDAGASLVLVEGNHDSLLETVAGPVDEHVLADGTLVCHGHEPPDESAERYVIGHDHPAIDIEGSRRPCFLFGPDAFRDTDVLCLPAFNELASGTRVNRLRGADVQSPLLADLDRFQPIVHDASADETFVFPDLRSIRSFL